MHLTWTVVFWGSLWGVFYSYLGYPALIWLIAKVHGGRQPVGDTSFTRDQDLPEVTVLITAYNAEDHLKERIENLLQSDYPADRLHVLIASDGSTDGTVDVGTGFDDDRVVTQAFPHRRGKAATLIDAVRRVTSPVIVFTDATTRFERESLRRLARHFQDPKVGLVAGRVSMLNEHGKPSESMYWRLEMMVRQCEARLGITLGATGAIYAVRRSLFVAPSRPIINDDLVLPMLVQMTHRCRLVLDSSARAFALSTGGMKAEFSRRCRIGNGALQCLPVLKDLLRWDNRWQAAAFVSHKLLRWACPFLLVAVFFSNLCLMSGQGYGMFLLIQVAAYAVAVYGGVASSQRVASRWARIATSFVVMNSALGVGIFRGLVRPNRVTWNPTARPSWNHLAVPRGSPSAQQNRAA